MVLSACKLRSILLKNSAMFKHIQLHADYLNPEEDEHVHLVDRSIQTTKRFDALKLWLTFSAVGANEYGEMVDHTIETAKQTADYLQKQRNVEVLNDPYMNAVVFRYVPDILYSDCQKQQHYENRLNQRIQQHLYEKGTFIMAKTKHKERVYLKLTMLNPMITFDSVVTHLEEVVALGKQLEKRRSDYVNAQLSANFITMQNIINCYIRETGKGVWQSVSEIKSEETLVLRLEKQPVTLYFPVKYRSATGRHLFFSNFSYRIQQEEIKELDIVTLLAFL